MNLFYRCFLLITFQFLYATADAQQPLLKHFSVEDGLPSNEVYKVMEDHSGYLLIATDRGLARYDGYFFNIIPTKFPSAIHPWYNIVNGTAGYIVITIGLKMGFYRRDSLEIKNYFKPDYKKYFANTTPYITNIASYKDTILLNINNEQTHSFEVYSLTDKSLLRHHQADGVYFDLQKGFYYQVSDYSSTDPLPIYIIRHNGRKEKLDVNASVDQSNSLFLFYNRFPEGELFITGKKMIFLAKNGQITQTTLPHTIFSFLPLDKDHFLIGKSKNGVTRYEIKNGMLNACPGIQLEGLSVTNIYRDRQQNLWFTTLESGLYKQIYTIPFSFNTGNKRLSFMTNKGDTVIAGFQSGLIRRIYDNRIINETQIPLAKEMVLKHGFIRDKQLIVGIENKKNRSTVFKEGNRILIKDYIPISKTDSGIYALMGRSLVFVNASTGKLRELCMLSSKIFSTLLKDNKIWIGTLNGLYVYENNKLKKITSSQQIFEDRIIAIQSLSKTKMAIASLSGSVAIYDKGIWYILNKSKGLKADVLNDMHTLGDTIWLSSNNGIFKTFLHKNKFITKRYGKSCGLPTLNIQNFALTGQYLYFIWHGQILSFNIENIRARHKIINKPFITSVIINGKKEANKASGRFNHTQNNLEITFNNIDFTAASEQTYRYRIANINPDWQVTKGRKATYFQLPPGKYTFELQITDNQQNFKTPSTTYHFEIVPAFWQRKSFPFLVSGLALLIILIIFTARFNAIKKKRQLMLELAESKIEVLALQISPHFIFNVLNNAQAAIIKENKMKAAMIIAKFAQIMRLLLEQSRSRFVSLEEELEWLKKYIELELIRMPGKFTFNIALKNIKAPEKLVVSAMLIQPFIENSIKHGITHLQNKTGHIQIAIEKVSDKLLLFTIEDNGIGREAAGAFRKDNKNKSRGISITLRRIKLLHEAAKTTFYFNIVDKLNDRREPEGTIVTFNIPFKTLNNDQYRP